MYGYSGRNIDALVGAGSSLSGSRSFVSGPRHAGVRRQSPSFKPSDHENVNAWSLTKIAILEALLNPAE